MTALSVPLQYPPRFAVTEAVELIDLTLADPGAVADYYRRNVSTWRCQCHGARMPSIPWRNGRGR